MDCVSEFNAYSVNRQLTFIMKHMLGATMNTLNAEKSKNQISN